jgi:hypothetical protein
MLAKVRSCAVVGLEGALVEVEVDLSNGLAGFMIVGLPDTAVNEAKDRVRAAIRNSGCLFPYKRITVNLAPADLRKEGPSYDLPIAIGILLASGQINLDEQVADNLYLGELSLDGGVRHTNGILPDERPSWFGQDITGPRNCGIPQLVTLVPALVSLTSLLPLTSARFFLNLSRLVLESSSLDNRNPEVSVASLLFLAKICILI